jgi:hypothetical protein
VRLASGERFTLLLHSAHRDEINAGIKAALGQLNGSAAAAASLVTGFGAAEPNQLGGLLR